MWTNCSPTEGTRVTRDNANANTHLSYVIISMLFYKKNRNISPLAWDSLETLACSLTMKAPCTAGTHRKGYLLPATQLTTHKTIGAKGSRMWLWIIHFIKEIWEPLVPLCVCVKLPRMSSSMLPPISTNLAPLCYYTHAVTKHACSMPCVHTYKWSMWQWRSDLWHSRNHIW